MNTNAGQRGPLDPKAPLESLPTDTRVALLEARVAELETALKAFQRYQDRYARFFGSFDEPFQGTTLT